MHRGIVALGGFLLLAGCGALNEYPVEGWPTLTVVEHHVAESAMRERCSRYVSMGMTPMACAEVDLHAARCDIWYGSGTPPAYVVEHERMHCQGYDHAGSTTMEEMLRRYRAEPSVSPQATRTR